MVKRLTLAAVTVLIAAAFVVTAIAPSFAKEYKIGYVDLAKVFDEYSKTRDSEKVLADKGKLKEEDRKRMIDEIRRLKDEQALLSEKGKAEKQAAIDEKISKLQDFDRKVREELTKERNDMLNGILKDIEKVVTDYSKETGYDVVVNSRMLLYGKEDMDLTAEILKRLNK